MILEKAAKEPFDKPIFSFLNSAEVSPYGNSIIGHHCLQNIVGTKVNAILKYFL